MNYSYLLGLFYLGNKSIVFKIQEDLQAFREKWFIYFKKAAEHF